MKPFFKFLVVILIAIFVINPQNLSAQDAKKEARNEISASSGVISLLGVTYTITDGMFSSIGSAFAHETIKFHHEGNLYLDYYYQYNWWLRFGAKVGAEVFKVSSYDDNGLFLRDRRTHFFTFMPSVQFSYLNVGLVKLYSGIDVGVTLGMLNMFNEVSIHPIFAFNITAIGVRVGNDHVFGLAEINAGYDSFGKLGIGVRF